MPDMRFREAIASLRQGIAGVRAIVLIGPDGVVVDYIAVDPGFDIVTFAAEYPTLLLIARRTSEDMGAGDLREHLSISERMIAFARSVRTGYYLILISDADAQIGRVRYELKRAANRLERSL